MAVRASKEVRIEIIQNVIERVRRNISAKQAGFAERFVKQYFNLVSTDDLKSRNDEDLYGAALSHFLFLNQCKSDTSRVRVYNPKPEEHGWRSPHTIVEIAHREMPFLVDSVRQEIVRHGLTVHLLIYPGTIYVKRDTDGRIIGVFNEDEADADPGVIRETPVYVEIDKQTDHKLLQRLQDDLIRIISDVEVAVEDWQPMLGKLADITKELEQCSSKEIDESEKQESIDFINWLREDNMTLLGLRDYDVVQENGKEILKLRAGSGLGLLREDRPSGVNRYFSKLPLENRPDEKSKILIIAKSNYRSTVHRTAYMDYIGIKRYDASGKMIGERRIVGLYTANVYNRSPYDIPFIRKKVQAILEYSGFNKKGHSEKELLNVLATFPRDDLFQGEVEELSEICLGILYLQERRKIKLFIRKDVYGRFFSCLLFVPKDVLNSEMREKFSSILLKTLNGIEINSSTQFTESVLARIQFIVRLSAEAEFPDYDAKELEKKLVIAGRTWQDELREELGEHVGEEKGNILFNQYGYAFPAGYRERYSAKTAVYDIDHIGKLETDDALGMTFYRPLEELGGGIRFKLFRRMAPLPLSDVMPILENMGMRVLSEHTHELILKDKVSVWINDFEMIHHLGNDLDVDSARLPFQECFYKLWKGEVENDALNRLILNASLSWREVVILRAYSKYFRQIGSTFSLNYIHETLNRNPEIASFLVNLFKVRFDTKKSKRSNTDKISDIQKHIQDGLEHVANLDEDRILRRYLDVILATVRTNYYQKNSTGDLKNYISLKMLPSKIPEVPLPCPMFEIFVYSPAVEGVHLRGSKVARGGIRWSDRREDYRTEILGLMKAQQVKNSVIVPAGAKGGFVPQNLPVDGSREEIMAEVIRCYSTFIRGLLDVTDNLNGRDVIPPKEVVRLDEDDPYLVVAADKGTATFSDIANAISKEYGFWLGDAFASGGSAGYDHKKMGITARGAWESVKRHFHELGIDVQKQNTTVLGIGDMAGDVFGNGMLQSRHILLVAAFNHQHIFLDPNPDPEISYQERDRLFHLSRSTWSDYRESCLSPGGGIFKRSAKSIKISPEVQERFQLSKDTFSPNELIKSLLKSPVDLLWNGGIGTYVKASSETDADVGDRSNDTLRVNGKDLRCRVVGEGGNLGMTQLGRVEYALNGGIGFTDFIDNVGGVNCSDHEVNIKILLDDVVRSADLTEKQRNQFLETMTQEVGELVIKDSYAQNRAISLAASRAKQTLDEYRLFIHELERMGRIDRELEHLPSEEVINERKAHGIGLTRPEISILVSYSKIYLKEELLSSELPEDRAVLDSLESEFPKLLQARFYNEMLNHKLKREIIATRLSSYIVNTMGFTFIKRLYDETGALPADIARAFVVAKEVFDFPDWYAQIEALDHTVSAEVQQNMIFEIVRLIRRVTRWFLRNRRMQLKITELINQFKPQVYSLLERLPFVVVADEKERCELQYKTLLEAQVPDALAHRMSYVRFMYSALDIIEVAHLNQFELPDVALVYFDLGARLELGWFREQINLHPVDDNWDALARAACRDDIDYQQRNIALAVLRTHAPENTLQSKIAYWSEYHQSLIFRWYTMLSELRATKSKEFTIFAVALRELLDLAQTSQNTIVPS